MTSVCMIPMRRQKRWQHDSGAERGGPKPKKPDATRRWKKQRTNAPLEPVEVAQPCQHTDFMLLASRTAREHISVALIRPWFVVLCQGSLGRVMGEVWPPIRS